MVDSRQEVRPSSAFGMGVVAAKRQVQRWGLQSVMTGLATSFTRRTYSRSTKLIPLRDELPHVLNARGLVGDAVEVGVSKGVFSEHILRHWAGRRLISVDPWVEMAPEEYIDTCNQSQDSMDESYEQTTERLAPFGRRSEIWRMPGETAVEKIDNGSLDFVYIDAQHSYEAVRRDLTMWFPLVRSGGILAGHDYNDGVFTQGMHGVRTAVDEFCANHDLTVQHTYFDTPSMSWVIQVP